MIGYTLGLRDQQLSAPERYVALLSLCAAHCDFEKWRKSILSKLILILIRYFSYYSSKLLFSFQKFIDFLNGKHPVFYL